MQVTGYPAWLIGYDWQGHPRATIHLKEVDNGGNIPFGISIAPNGSGFTAGEYTFDRAGNSSNSTQFRPPKADGTSNAIRGDFLTTAQPWASV